MRYTAAIAAAFVAGAVASYEPTDYSMDGHDVAEPKHDDYDCDGEKCDDDHDDDYDCHDDDSYDCKMSSSSYYSSSSDYHSSSDYYSTSDYHYSSSVDVHPVPTSTYYDTIYTTDVVEHYETYCPEPTEVVYNKKTYTVTEATTLTIVDCPCTVTRPVVTSVITECPEHECPTEKPTPVDTILATDTVVVVPVDTHAPVVPVEPIDTHAPVVPVEPIDTVIPAPVDTVVPVVPVSPVEPVVEPVAPFPVNSTVAVAPVGTGVASPSATLFEGAGSKVTFSGAGLAAVFAAVVYAL